MFKRTQALRILLNIILVCTILFSLTGCRKADEPEPVSETATEVPQVTETKAEPETTAEPEAAEPDIAAETEAAEPETAEPETAEAPESTTGPEDTDAPETKAGTEPQEAPEASAEADANVTFAAGYVRVVSPTKSGWLPLPEEEDYVFPLRQLREDGTEEVNMIHVMPNGVYMESATCENQDCVHQGEVTLDNISERILGNMIICLPNQVYLELYSTEELLGAE